MIKFARALSTKLIFLVDRLTSLTRRLGQSLTHYQCHFCDTPTDKGAWICNGCYADLPWNRYHCERCSLPLNAPLPHLVCGECLSSPPAFFLGISAFHYELPVDHAILQLKHQQKRYFAPLLADMLAFTVEKHYSNDTLPDILIPVPIHRSKRKLRGFNQSQLIAERLSKALNVPIDIKTLYKFKATPSQTDLNKSHRTRNLRGSFQIKKRLEGMHVALVDDVMTTRATSELLSSLLYSAGAQRVDVWCLARTAKNHIRG